MQQRFNRGIAFAASALLVTASTVGFVHRADAQVGLAVGLGLSLARHAARHSSHYRYYPSAPATYTVPYVNPDTGEVQSIGPDSNNAPAPAATPSDAGDSSWSGSDSHPPSPAGDSSWAGSTRRYSTPPAGGKSSRHSSTTHYTSSRERVRSHNRAIEYFNKGAHYSNDEEYGQAIDCYRQALAIDPSLNAHGPLGYAYTKERDYQNGFSELEQAIRKNKSDANSWYWLGECAQHVYRYKIARDCYAKVIAIGGDADKSQRSQRAMDILDHNFLGEGSGDYLADATRQGTNRWSDTSMPLKVYIEKDSQASGYHGEFAQSLQEAFQDWAGSSHGKVGFQFVDDPAQANIKCAWTDDVTKMGSLEELGLTHTVFDQDGIIQSATIDLYTLADRPNTPVEQLVRTAKAVQLHEIGHAMGMSHSQNAYDIMYPITAPEGLEFALTTRDKNTLAALYDAKDIADASKPSFYSSQSALRRSK